MALLGFLGKDKKESLNKGLEKTKESVFHKLSRAVVGKSKVDEEVLDNLEDVLVSSDVGVTTTLSIIKLIEARVAKDKYLNTSELNSILKEEIVALLEGGRSDSESDFSSPLKSIPYVIMVVGVNGAGKTTTIAKLAYQYKASGKKVLIGAADTFRAAAIEQLQIWADRVGVPIVKQQMGSDPASVAFDTLRSAVANGSEVVIIDTAGKSYD
jgi:fused signal recognition particle receptor